MDNVATQAMAARQVLYVEDNPVNVMLVEAVFSRRKDCTLHVAMTGKEAWTLSAQLHPVLLLIDLRLPDCYGTQLLDLLRQRPGWEETRAIAVTAEYGFDIEGTGFSELWTKPLDLPWMMGRLDRLLQAQDAEAPRTDDPIDRLHQAPDGPARTVPAMARTAGARSMFFARGPGLEPGDLTMAI